MSKRFCNVRKIWIWRVLNFAILSLIFISRIEKFIRRKEKQFFSIFHKHDCISSMLHLIRLYICKNVFAGIYYPGYTSEIKYQVKGNDPSYLRQTSFSLLEATLIKFFILKCIELEVYWIENNLNAYFIRKWFTHKSCNPSCIWF